MPRLDVHAHYQIRLVKRIDGATIVTHMPMAQAKSQRDKDKTLDFTAGSEKGALQKARNYCRRGPARKGELPGEFLGVVLAKHVSPLDKAITYALPGQVTKRPKRVVGTTEWLYFVDPDSQAFHVNPSTHNIVGRVDTSYG